MFGARVIILLSSILTFSQAAKILGVFPYMAHSHYTLGFRLMKELADKGHEVTFINAYPRKKPIKNFRDIPVDDIKKPVGALLKELVDFGQYSYVSQLEWMLRLGNVYTEGVLRNENVKNLLNSDEKFDLVIVEHFFNEAMTIFAHHFSCPFIYFAPGPTSSFNNHLLANPAPPSYVPNLSTVYGSRMNFLQRLENTFYDIVTELFVHHRLIPEQTALLKSVFPDAPNLQEILYNASMMLVMSHVSIQDPVPLQQNIKAVGGHHLRPLEPLPKNIQEFMDKATEGVVVFSMGSNLKSSDFDPDKKRAILNGFAKIKQKVLWKFETDLEGKPSNVMISKWLPQQDVLAHPNTVAFISHCGLLSSFEAVYYGVPILGLPVFWDQYKNIEELSRTGMAIKLNFQDLDEVNFEAALNEILDNPKYRKEGKLRSRIMQDQPMKQLDEAVFWVEYVIRHAGAPHLRSAAIDLKWYQKYLIDIFVFLGVICSGIFFISYCFARYLIFNRSKSVYSSKKYE